MRMIGGNLNSFTTLMKIVAVAHMHDELSPYNKQFYENLRDAAALADRFETVLEITVKQYNHLNQLAYDVERLS